MSAVAVAVTPLVARVTIEAPASEVSEVASPGAQVRLDVPGAMPVGVVQGGPTLVALGATPPTTITIDVTAQVAAGLSALANLAVELEALGGLEDSNLRGTLSMAADLTTEGSVETLTAAAVARAVWDEALASHTDDGSAGDTLARVSKIVKAILGLSA